MGAAGAGSLLGPNTPLGAQDASASPGGDPPSGVVPLPSTNEGFTPPPGPAFQKVTF